MIDCRLNGKIQGQCSTVAECPRGPALQPMARPVPRTSDLHGLVDDLALAEEIRACRALTD